MIYLYLTIFAAILLSASSPNNTIINNRFTNNSLLTIMFITVSLSIYNIDLYTIPDALNYAERTILYTYMPFELLNTNITEDAAFNILQWILAQFTDSIKAFLLLVWFIIFVNITVAAKNVFKPNEVLFVVFAYLTYFIFFDYALNAVRQGLAISFLIVALSIIVSKKRNLYFYIALALAPLMHVSALPLSIALMILKRKFITLKFVGMIWMVALAAFVTGLNAELLGNLRGSLDDYTSTYVLGNIGDSFNRIDFMLFSVFFAVLLALMKRYIVEDQESFAILFKFYLLANSYFLFFGFINFSDRLASYSWMLIPLILFQGIQNTVNLRYKRVLLVVLFFITGMITGSIDFIFES